MKTVFNAKLKNRQIEVTATKTASEEQTVKRYLQLKSAVDRLNAQLDYVTKELQFAQDELAALEYVVAPVLGKYINQGPQRE